MNKIQVLIVSSVATILLTLFGCSSKSITEPIKDTALKGWELNLTNTGIAKAGLQESDLTVLDLSSGEDAGKGVTNYSGVPGNIYIYANQTIENKIISPSYQLHLTAGNITLKNCIIRPSAIGTGLPAIVADGNARLENCDIDGTILGNTGIAIAINGTIIGCNIWGFSTGISINNPVGTTQSVCEGNYIHDLEGFTGAHMDGITIRVSVGNGVVVRNNRSSVSWTTPALVTGALFLQSQEGVLDTVLIEGNLLEGHGYTLSMGISSFTFGTHVRVVNNRFNPYPDGWGAVAIQEGISLAEWSSNYLYDSSAPDGKGAVVNY